MDNISIGDIIKMNQDDFSLANLLELDGIRYLIDESHGLWVKFQAKRVTKTKERPHGINYSLTLHDRANNRIMGFDNAHAVKDKSYKNSSTSYDHWHRGGEDKGKKYNYKSAGKLLEDFWAEVDKKLKLIKGGK